MRFIADGPDIPDELIRQQMSGDVVFVVGAGVSAAAGLPAFPGLVQGVYDRLGLDRPESRRSEVAEAEAWQLREYDRVLGLLERRLGGTQGHYTLPRGRVMDALPRLNP